MCVVACWGFSPDAVCVVADMMCNRCEAVRRGDVRSCPTARVLPHLPLKAWPKCVCICIFMYGCVQQQPLNPCLLQPSVITFLSGIPQPVPPAQP